MGYYNMIYQYGENNLQKNVKENQFILFNFYHLQQRLKDLKKLYKTLIQ